MINVKVNRATYGAIHVNRMRSFVIDKSDSLIPGARCKIIEVFRQRDQFNDIVKLPTGREVVIIVTDVFQSNVANVDDELCLIQFKKE